MKLTKVLTLSTIALLGASAANADLTLTLDNPFQTFAGAGMVNYTGLISNDTTMKVMLDGDSLAPYMPGDDLPTFDITLGGDIITLNPGDTFYGDWLFGIMVDNSAREGDYAVSGMSEDLSGNTNPVLLTARFGASPSAVPEPGTMALLASSLVGGAFLIRRRK